MTAKVEWIVCDGAERPVTEGLVDCPRQQALTARLVEVDTCLLCRHLMATPIDRDRLRHHGVGTQLPGGHRVRASPPHTRLAIHDRSASP